MDYWTKIFLKVQSMTSKCHTPKCPFFPFLFYYSPKIVQGFFEKSGTLWGHALYLIGHGFLISKFSIGFIFRILEFYFWNTFLLLIFYRFSCSFFVLLLKISYIFDNDVDIYSRNRQHFIFTHKNNDTN